MAFPPCVSDECGIVAQISQPLADGDISAYYISTFSFDHALVSPEGFPMTPVAVETKCIWVNSFCNLHLSHFITYFWFE